MLEGNCDRLCLSDLFGAGVPDSEGPLGVVGEHSGALHRHQEAAILLLPLCWPVLITLPLREQDVNTSNTMNSDENAYVN